MGNKNTLAINGLTLYLYYYRDDDIMVLTGLVVIAWYVCVAECCNYLHSLVGLGNIIVLAIYHDVLKVLISIFLFAIAILSLHITANKKSFSLRLVEPNFNCNQSSPQRG